MMFGLTVKELSLLAKLDSPAKIQDFLDGLKINFEENGETCMSPRRVLAAQKCHCMEGAMLAALALKLHGYKPLILHMKGTGNDWDHILAVFKEKGFWGAISKSNHPVLRYREPVYRDIRELVMSYFHEYTDSNGNKTLRSYSNPFDLSRFDKRGWMTDGKCLWYIDHCLDRVKHYPVLSPRQSAGLRRADRIETALDRFHEWSPGKNRKNRHLVRNY